jgi:hypothetical protein
MGNWNFNTCHMPGTSAQPYNPPLAKVLVVKGACICAQNLFLFFAKDVKKCSEVRKVIPLCRVQLPPLL